MKKHIADALGQIAGSALVSDENCWPEFKLHLWELFKQDNQGCILAAFTVLETFLPLSPTTFENHASDLFTLFKNGLSNDSKDIKLSALHAFESYLGIL